MYVCDKCYNPFGKSFALWLRCVDLVGSIEFAVDITSNTFISAQRLSERRSAERVCE
jgi:hypothetical protein